MSTGQTSSVMETDQRASDHIGFYSCATVPADFARRLERERDAARKERNMLVEALRRIAKIDGLHNNVGNAVMMAHEALASLNLNQDKE